MRMFFMFLESIEFYFNNSKSVIQKTRMFSCVCVCVVARCTCSVSFVVISERPYLSPVSSWLHSNLLEYYSYSLKVLHVH